MSVKKWRLAAALSLLALFGILLQQSLDGMLFPWLHKINYYYRNTPTPYAKRYLDTLSPKDRAVIERHLDHALASLESRENEVEIAAAINSYLHQYLLSQYHSGDALAVLNDGHAVCGGHAVAMTVLLQAAGLESRLAYLLDIPELIGHSFVELQYKDGQKGLFDPTYGVLWYDQEKRKPYSMAELHNDPTSAEQKGLQSIYKKRQDVGESIEGHRSIDQNYTANGDAPNYKLLFERASAAGVVNSGETLFRHIEIHCYPSTLGSTSPQNLSSAIDSLQSCQEATKQQAWLHLLGKQAYGLKVSQVYTLTNTRPGQRYRITLHYARSTESIISATAVGGQLQQKDGHYPIDNFAPRLIQKLSTGWLERSRKVQIDVISEADSVTLILNNEGSLVLHAIEAQEI